VVRRNVYFAGKAGFVIALVLLAALAFSPQEQQAKATEAVDTPVAPEQVLAWQLEGLTQEEIREEVKRRGLSQCAELPLLNALSAARAEAETVTTVKHAKAPCTLWKLGLRLPGPTDYLYEVAGAILWSDWGHALETMQTEVNKQPKNPNVRLIYAHLLRMSEDWIPAYGEVTEAVALDSQSPYTHALRSTICYHSGLTPCAVREAVTFVKMKPDDAAAYIILGHAKELQGDDAEALMAYCEAKRLYSGYAEIHEGLGRIHARQGEFENAVAAFEEAIRLDGNEAEYYAELASVYQSEGYMPQAIEKWKKAKEIEPERPQFLIALANAYLAAERYPEAVREYEELLKIVPDDEKVMPQLAKALRAEGRLEEADQVHEDSEKPTNK
jgi:tetratricopeptide (TPR) repeat protein